MKTLIELKKEGEEAAKKMTEQRIAGLELEIVSAIADGRDYLRVEGLSERVLDVLKDAGYSYEFVESKLSFQGSLNKDILLKLEVE